MKDVYLFCHNNNSVAMIYDMTGETNIDYVNATKLLVNHSASMKIKFQKPKSFHRN